MRGVSYSAGCAASSISDIESGRTKDIGIVLARKLSLTMGIPLEDLAWAATQDALNADAAIREAERIRLRDKARAKRKRQLARDKKKP